MTLNALTGFAPGFLCGLFLPACKRGQVLYRWLTLLTAAVYMFPLKQSRRVSNEFACVSMQVGGIQGAEEGAWFSLEWLYLAQLSSSLPLGGVSVALSPPSLSNPQHPPSPSLNHSDPAHLEPMCFSILSSTVVISNQPMGLSLSPHQQPRAPKSSHPCQRDVGQVSLCLPLARTEKKQKKTVFINQ